MNRQTGISLAPIFLFIALPAIACQEMENSSELSPGNIALQSQGMSEGPADRLVRRGYSTDRASLLLLAEGVGIQDSGWEFDVRRDAMSLLVDRPGKDVVALLSRVTKKDKEESMRDAAMFALARLGDYQAFQGISQAFEEADADRKVSLALSFSETGLPEATPLLLEALKIAPAERLSVLVNFLRRRGVRSGFTEIESVLLSSNKEDWTGAADALTEYSYDLESAPTESERVRDLLWSILDADDDQLKEIVLERLFKICTEGLGFDPCVEKLKDPASISPDPRLQEMVLEVRTRIEKRKRVQPAMDRIEELRKQQLKEEKAEGHDQ